MNQHKFSRNTYNPNNVSRGQFGTIVQDHTESLMSRPLNTTKNISNSRSSSVPSHKKLKYASNTLKQIDSIVSFYQKHPFRIINLNNFLSIETMDNHKFIPLSTSNFKPRYNFTATNICLRLFNNATKQFQWENSIAIFGGRSSENTPPNEQISKGELVLYNINLRSWLSLNFLTEEPKLRYAHATVSHNGNLYVFGGTDGIHFNNDFLIISIASIHCTCSTISGIRRASEKWPSPRCSHSLTKIEYDKDEKKNNNEETFKAYMFGGIENSGDLSGELWEVTCGNGILPTWRLVSQNGPPPRFGHIAFVKNGKFYIAGGYDQNGKPLKDIWMYDETKEEKKQRETKKPQTQTQSQSQSQGAPQNAQLHGRSKTLLPNESTQSSYNQAGNRNSSGFNPDISHRIRNARTANEYHGTFGSSGSETDLRNEVKPRMPSSSSFNQFAEQIESNEFEGHSESITFGGWTQLAVFDPDPTAFGFDGNLYLVKDPDNSIAQIKENKTLALLDDKFSQHSNFKSTKNNEKENEREMAVNLMYRNKLYEYQELEKIKKDIAAPPVSQNANKGLTEASNYFNSDKANSLLDEIDKMRKEFLQTSLNIVKNHVEQFCYEEEVHENFTEKFISSKKDELNTLINRYKNRCSEVKMELDLSQQLLDSLGNSAPANIDDQSYKLSIDYAKALIELDTKRQKILRLRERIKKNKEKSGIIQQQMNDLMKNIAYAELMFKQETSKRDEWNDYVEDSIVQLQAADTTIESIIKGTSNEVIQSKLAEVKKSHNDLLDKTFGKEREDALLNIEGALKMIKNNIPFQIVKDKISEFYAVFMRASIPQIVDSTQQHENAIKYFQSKTFQNIQMPTHQQQLQYLLQQPVHSNTHSSAKVPPKSNVPQIPSRRQTVSRQQNRVMSVQPQQNAQMGQQTQSMQQSQTIQPNRVIPGQPQQNIQTNQQTQSMQQSQSGQPNRIIPGQPQQNAQMGQQTQSMQQSQNIQPNRVIPGQPQQNIQTNQQAQSMQQSQSGQPNRVIPGQPQQNIQTNQQSQSGQPNRGPMPGQPQQNIQSGQQPQSVQPNRGMPGQPLQNPQQGQQPQSVQPNRGMPGQPLQNVQQGQPNRAMPGQPNRPMFGQQMQPGQNMQNVQSGQQMPNGQPNRGPMPGQPNRGPMPGQPNRGPMPGQMPNQMPGQMSNQMSNQMLNQMPGQPGQMPGQQPQNGQPNRGPMPGQPGQMPGQPNRGPMPGQPNRGPMPGQPNRAGPGQPNRGMPGQPMQPGMSRHMTVPGGQPRPNLGPIGPNMQQRPANQQPMIQPLLPQQQQSFWQQQQQQQQHQHQNQQNQQNQQNPPQ